MRKMLVICGASSDLGISLLDRSGGEYDELVTIFRSRNERLEEILIRLRSMAKRVMELQCDLADSDSCDAMVQQLEEIMGQKEGYEVHFVHFPAPKATIRKFVKTSWKIFQKEIDISIKSFVMVSQVLLPVMQRAKAGRIVVMLSYVVQNIPPKYVAHYTMAKYALLGVMKSLAVEYADKGITVNGVSPAAVETKFLSEQSDIVLEKWRQESPLGRNLQVDEVVPTIEFLLSESACRINGENIVISCGMKS